MEFRIADTFTDSLARLTGDEQKAVKTTAFDLQMNPASPGHSFHKLDKARDKNFWSVRVNSDIRLIVHKTQGSLLLCYVDHHDKAYDWASRRKIETHPTTGAAQIVEIRETVKEITVPIYVQEEQPKPKQLLFSEFSDVDLFQYGVPKEWLDDVRQSNEDTLLAITDHLPAEAAEALLEIATGGKPRLPAVTAPEASFEHPDAQRRFKTVHNADELQQALEYPWDKWTIFLHPAQKEMVERSYSGPARVSGSAGTGKTVVALHRAAHLARSYRDSRVLLATFSDALANALRTKLRRLISSEPHLGEGIEVHSLDDIGRRLYELNIEQPNIVSREVLRQLLEEASQSVENHKFSLHFLMTEWDQVVDAWQLDTWEAYRDVMRLGRKTRLPENRRQVLWSIFERVQENLKKQDLITDATLFNRLAVHFQKAKHKPFDFAVVDESQDLSIAQLKFLAALGASGENGLFFAGDLGQRIFQQPFSWKSLGVDIRGRSRTLNINYRTSHQIRLHADRLLNPEIADVDGNVEDRSNTVSVFNGVKPSILTAGSIKEETAAVARWLEERSKAAVVPHEIGVFVRSAEQLGRAKEAISAAGLKFKVLDDRIESHHNHVAVSTMHLAKGLEFRAVAVMACDDEIIPLKSRIESVADDADLEEVYNTERHLLYVACTRARDFLLVSGVNPTSEFLDDLCLAAM